MSKLTLASLIVLASIGVRKECRSCLWPVRNTRGGPAGLLISNTGGPVLRRAGVYRNPAYAYAGTHAGGPADLLISSTGGPVLRHARPYRDLTYASSGSHAGGPAALFYSQTGRYR